ncbi:hypothetical protein DLAC_08658 [Tieghemostelium lacteum]|uniref:Uncharacterized protein n=1 Tax=Tieghemostelium lacteum TaxID=361077 RepID=A0A151Z7Y0_TIELA|nr:hypothetical protein DLAC_08658 [Tieghemostelium lacteum]|eukprot:KYQ90076.1 hypothetical protein DLAC_08658 [Tieghemostelium lacteum]
MVISDHFLLIKILNYYLLDIGCRKTSTDYDIERLVHKILDIKLVCKEWKEIVPKLTYLKTFVIAGIPENLCYRNISNSIMIPKICYHNYNGSQYEETTNISLEKIHKYYYTIKYDHHIYQLENFLNGLVVPHLVLWDGSCRATYTNSNVLRHSTAKDKVTQTIKNFNETVVDKTRAHLLEIVYSFSFQNLMALELRYVKSSGPFPSGMIMQNVKEIFTFVESYKSLKELSVVIDPELTIPDNEANIDFIFQMDHLKSLDKLMLSHQSLTLTPNVLVSFLHGSSMSTLKLKASLVGNTTATKNNLIVTSLRVFEFDIGDNNSQATLYNMLIDNFKDLGRFVLKMNDTGNILDNSIIELLSNIQSDNLIMHFNSGVINGVPQLSSAPSFMRSLANRNITQLLLNTDIQNIIDVIKCNIPTLYKIMLVLTRVMEGSHEPLLDSIKSNNYLTELGVKTKYHANSIHIHTMLLNGLILDCPSLQHLDYSYNTLKEDLFDKIFPEWLTKSNLISLNIQGCKFLDTSGEHGYLPFTPFTQIPIEKILLSKCNINYKCTVFQVESFSNKF